MVIIESYKDLLSEIELLGWLHDDLIRQLQRNEKDCWGHGMPLPKALAQYDNIIERMQNIEDELAIKNELKQRIEDRINQFTGIEYAVAYKREIEGKSLQIIADEMKCSYSLISKISMKIKNEKSVKDKVVNV